MKRLHSALVSFILTLLLAACGGSGSGDGPPTPPTTAEEIQERVEQLTDPQFLGSRVLIIHDGSSERLAPPVCNVDRCGVDNHDTTLEELLGATGFQHTETHHGVALGRGMLSHYEGEIHRLGGWLSGSAFAVHSGVLTDGEEGTPSFLSENIIHGYSVGQPTGTNPVDGNAIWRGVMVGADTSGTATTGNFVQGDATLTASFSDATVDVLFGNITDQTTGVSHPNIAWEDVVMDEGEFRSGALLGRFYGTDHAEVGGIFERGNLLGAFGATRP